MPPKKVPLRRCPTEVRAMASSKVARIQAAIADLAVDDIEEKASLEAALVRAQRQASVPPVDKRIAFIERGKKRVAAESAKILEAEKTRRIYQDEFEHAEKICRRFARRPRGRRLALSSSIQWQSSKRSWRVRAQLVQLQGSRPDPEVACGPNVKRPCLSGQGREGIPPMPTLVPAELSAWLSERHSDLHDALINGDPSCVPGAHHNVVRRARTFGGNDRKDVAVSFTVISSCRRVTKWGLRGVRVGEASNPGRASDAALRD